MALLRHDPPPQELWDRVVAWEKDLRRELDSAETPQQHALSWLGISDAYAEMAILLSRYGDEIRR